MLCAIIAAGQQETGIWSETFGLLFTFVILLPVLATGLIIVSIISGRGDKKVDDELRGKWGRKRPPAGS